MARRRVSKRNPFLLIVLAAAVGTGLLLHSGRASRHGTLTQEKSDDFFDMSGVEDWLVQHVETTLFEEQIPVAQRMPTAVALEAHEYGAELLRQDRHEEAESILLTACDGGDLTSCLVLGEEFIRNGRAAEGEPILIAACRGGQHPGCLAILNHAKIVSVEALDYALENLVRACRDQDDATACTMIADSEWARRGDRENVRRYLGLACSRGDDRSCTRLKNGS